MDLWISQPTSSAMSQVMLSSPRQLNCWRYSAVFHHLPQMNASCVSNHWWTFCKSLASLATWACVVSWLTSMLVMEDIAKCTVSPNWWAVLTHIKCPANSAHRLLLTSLQMSHSLSRHDILVHFLYVSILKSVPVTPMAVVPSSLYFWNTPAAVCVLK